MKYLLAFAAAFLLAVLGVSALPNAKVLGVTPDLLLVFAACWAVVRGQREAMLVVPAAGLLRDLTTSDPLGTSVLALSPIVLLAAVRELRAVETEFVPALAVVGVGTLLYWLLNMGVLAATDQEVPWLDAILRVALPAALVNALFTPIVYLPVRWLSPAPRPGTLDLGRTVVS